VSKSQAANSAIGQHDGLNLRDFIAQIEKADPSSVWRIKEPVSLDYDTSAMVMRLDEQGRSPVLWFDNVIGSPFPIVTNLFGARARYAAALGVPESELITHLSKQQDKIIDPVMRESGPIHDVVLTDDEVDLAKLPILGHFAEDAGRYITNAIVIAKDPATGIRNASFHRMEVKGPRTLGTSLHSRRHLWSYVNKAEEMEQDTPIAIVIGAHPLFTFGGLWKGAIATDEYAIVGGLMGAPLEIAAGRTVPVEVPVHAEIVLEGRIVSKKRAPEGPFAEFTGYASERSTQHVVEISAILHRKNAIYHDIVPGISNEHTSLLAVPQEARLLRTLRQQYPNVTAVAYPKSGTCRLHAYIALRNAAAGQARNAASAAFGDDLSLKLVIVVDDDVDVYNDSEVLWALATRMQADNDIDVLHNAMGAILDPSNRDGMTAKLVIDATRPAGHFPARHTIPSEAIQKALSLIQSIDGKK
jgi:UbiD family decarboxylase